MVVKISALFPKGKKDFFNLNNISSKKIFFLKKNFLLTKEENSVQKNNILKTSQDDYTVTEV